MKQKIFNILKKIIDFYKSYFKDIDNRILWISWLIFMVVCCILNNKGIIGKIVTWGYVLIFIYYSLKNIIFKFFKKNQFTKNKDYSHLA